MLVALAAMLSGAGCVQAGELPFPSTSAAVSESPLPSVTDTPAAPLGSPSPSASATATPSPTPAITPVPDAVLLQNLPAAPTGTWTSLRWVELPGAGIPPISSAIRYMQDNATLDGWRDGYVEFIWDPWRLTLVPWTSADGLSWKKGRTLDTSVWAADVSPGESIDVNSGPTCSFDQTMFAHGPSNLMLRGRVACEGGCGSGVYLTSEGTWVSRDGLTWTPVDVARLFGAATVDGISGGPNGYMAVVDGSGAGKAIWTSGDGLSWQRKALPTQATAGGATIGGPAAFSGGFVAPGVVEVQNGAEVGPTQGCAITMENSTPRPALHRGALWFSPDGSTWTRGSLPGVVDATWATMTVSRMDDHLLIATEFTPGGEKTWISSDGKSWQASAVPYDVLDGGARSLLYERPAYGSSVGAFSFYTMDGTTCCTRVAETGTHPTTGKTLQMAIGPKGLLVTSDGDKFWMGVPSAG